MAVWMQIFGKNNFSTDLNLIKKKFIETVPNLKLGLNFLNGIIYPEVAFYANIDESLSKNIYNLSENYYEYENKWTSKISKNSENQEYLNFHYPIYQNNGAGIDVFFFNEVIMLTGLFDHFSSWFRFCENKNISEGYIDIAEKICSIFVSPSLYLCSEWCICGEEFNLNFSEFEEYIHHHPETLKNTLKNLESFEIYKKEIKDR